MATINVCRDNPDRFYRYKMEPIQAKVEGKGNGIKTVIVNLNNVAQALGRPPAYLIKFFGFELGAQANAKPTGDRWIINGNHEASKLQLYLDGFIKKFVLCKECKNPETEVVIKDPKILLDCKACGERFEVDPRHKLSTFILKNQPKKGKKDRSTKKTRREKHNNGQTENGENGEVNGSPGDSNSDPGDENGDEALEAHSDDEFTRRINQEAKDIEQSKEIEDDEWAVDVSEEAVKARAKELPDDLKRSLVFDDGDEEGADADGGPSSYDQLGSWIMEEAAKSGKGVAAVGDVDIYMKAKELGIETKHKTLAVLAQTIFDERIVKQIHSRAGMLKKMITSERHEKAFLGGTERFAGKDHPELIPSISAILLAYYQEDLVSEEVLKAWGSKASKKYVDLSTSKKVRKSAEKFLEWLETAESEDEDEDEDEE